MDIIMLVFYQPPTSMDIFYALNTIKYGKFQIIYISLLVLVVNEGTSKKKYAKVGSSPIYAIYFKFKILYFSSSPWAMGSPQVPLVSKTVHKYGHGGGAQAHMNCALLYRYRRRANVQYVTQNIYKKTKIALTLMKFCYLHFALSVL